MTEKPAPLDDDFDDVDEVDDADVRLAEVLRGESSSEVLRHTLISERSETSEDLLARLDALDFVQKVVGGTTGVPARIAEYEIKGLLGRGGMGTVYLGFQKDLEREVALKVLSPHCSADPTMRKRFRAEARATAALHHRHIVPIYDYGEAQGLLFFTMERVDGMSLDKHIASARRLRRAPMAPTEAAHRFAGVADALGLAHRRRLLHRDVKPGNILVAGDGTLALTDFGLAKALDNVSAQLTSNSGGFLGTLHYSSPEQALGADLTPASDLYSLGVTMFEAVTGELPFAAKTTEALLSAILHGTPRRLREVLPKAPRDLDALNEKLLSREPADRYQDGEALARDLLRIRDGEPVHIRRQPLHVRVMRRARKNPGLSGAIAAAVVLLLLTVVLLTVWRRERGEGLVSRHENNLVQIATNIGNELGGPYGPEPLLLALTGVAAPAVPPSAAVLELLRLAHRELPGDARVDAMERAYVDDPLPAASELLREGRGYEAMRLYDRAITDAFFLRTGGDQNLAVELRLYRLYLGRSVANLTAAVAHLTDARADLALAAYLRPGAAFPRTLLAVLDVAQSSDVPSAIGLLERELATAAAERVEVTAHLLRAVAGLRPLANANLMQFALSYPHRRQVHQLAQRLLSDEPEPEPEAAAAFEQPTGLHGRLAERARDALARLADPTARRQAVDRARAEIRACVHPESPLRGWVGVLQLIEEPQQRGQLVDADGQPLPPLIQLAAWRNLIHLAPSRQMMTLLLPRFEELYRRQPNLPGMLPVAARMHLLAGSPLASDLIAAWVVEAEGDPVAQLWRMRVRLEQGAVTDAMDDAMVAVQESVSHEDAIAEILRLCDAAGVGADAARGFGILTLQQSFKLLQTEIGGQR